MQKKSPFKRGQAYYDSLAASRADCADAVAIRTAGRHLRNHPEDAQPIFNMLGRDFPIDSLGPQAEDALIRLFAGKNGAVFMSAAFGGLNDKNCFALADKLLSNKLPSDTHHRLVWYGQQVIDKLGSSYRMN